MALKKIIVLCHGDWNPAEKALNHYGVQKITALCVVLSTIVGRLKAVVIASRAPWVSETADIIEKEVGYTSLTTDVLRSDVGYEIDTHAVFNEINLLLQNYDCECLIIVTHKDGVEVLPRFLSNKFAGVFIGPRPTEYVVKTSTGVVIDLDEKSYEIIPAK